MKLEFADGTYFLLSTVLKHFFLNFTAIFIFKNVFYEPTFNIQKIYKFSHNNNKNEIHIVISCSPIFQYVNSLWIKQWEKKRCISFKFQLLFLFIFANFQGLLKLTVTNPTRRRTTHHGKHNKNEQILNHTCQ